MRPWSSRSKRSGSEWSRRWGNHPPLPSPPQGTQHPKPSWVLMSPLPPQSTARSRLHCAVLQRALDARDREVQRLVAAQEEVS